MLVRRQGYAGFSYADLARIVGIRTASIHYYFPTKEDLGLALVDAYDARYDVALARLLDEDPDTMRRIEGYAALYVQGVNQNAGCLCAALAIEVATLPNSFREAISAFFQKHLAWLERVLKEGVERGDVRRNLQPDAGARMILSALEGGLMMERVLDHNDGLAMTLDAIRMTVQSARGVEHVC